MTTYYVQGKAFTLPAINQSFTDTRFLRKIFGAIFKNQDEILLKESAVYIPALEDIDQELKDSEDEKEEKEGKLEVVPLYRPFFRTNFKPSGESESKTSSSASVKKALVKDIELVAHEFNGLWVKFSRPITQQVYESKNKDFFDNWATKYTPNFRPSYLKLLTESKQSIHTQNARILLQNGPVLYQEALKLTKQRTNLAFVKKLCSDYSSRLTNFFCFHWNRHNQAYARQIIRNIELKQKTYEENPLELAKFIAWRIAELEPTLNKEGSFKRRMDLAIAQITDGQYLDAEAVLKKFPYESTTEAELKTSLRLVLTP